MKDKYRSRRSMTPTDYRDALADLGLTQSGAARFLGVDGKTSRDWANPTMPGPPEPVARFLDYLIGAKVTPAEVLAVLAKMETEE